jgi:hypothetical protein
MKLINKIQQKIYEIWQKTKRHISSFVGGQFKKRQRNEIKEPMTLCIANINNKGNVEFWSDSRLNYGDNNPIDMAVKVVSFPVIIYNINDKSTPDYNQNWGICFAGGGQTIYYIKDFILENLRNLEYSSDIFDITANKISNYIRVIYKIAVQKFVDKLSLDDGGCELITTGFCPKEKRFITYYYTIKFPIDDWDDIEIIVNELTDKIKFIGNGKYVAQKLYDDGLKNPYQIMKKIIDENLNNKVGGQIQFGENVNLDFKVKGVAKIENHKTITQLRGVDLYDVNLFDYTQDLKPTTSFLINLKEIK